MGKRGPAPAPTALKTLKGQRTPNRSREPQPAVTHGVPQPPEGVLDERGQAVWDRLAPDLHRMGVLTTWDVDALAVWCQAVVNHREAARAVNEEGVMLGRVKHPALQVMRDSATTILQFGGRFGLTPSDRQALVTDEVDREDDARRLLAG